MNNKIKNIKEGQEVVENVINELADELGYHYNYWFNPYDNKWYCYHRLECKFLNSDWQQKAATGDTLPQAQLAMLNRIQKSES